MNDAGSVQGVRPLGGKVEFGETAEAAVIREFEEELWIKVQVVGAPMFVENIFSHEGQVGREVLAIFYVDFPAGSFESETRISFSEDNGIPCFAEWYALDALDLPGALQLYSAGLKAFLRK